MQSLLARSKTGMIKQQEMKSFLHKANKKNYSQRLYRIFIDPKGLSMNVCCLTAGHFNS